MIRLGTGIATSVALLALAGCSGLPERVAGIEQARQSIAAVEREPLADRAAARELAAARDALAAADSAFDERAPLPLIEHHAYLARRYADIARELVAEAHAREEVERGEAERDRIIVESRARAAQAAARKLEAQARVAQAQARVTESADERGPGLEDLEARDTDRGLVLTLGDVLFDAGTATLKAGATTAVDRLAQFMRDYPERSIRIEGHTDSAGSDESNRNLSERRAQAVREALVARGLEAQRIATLGYGEARPIANNDTPGGREQNRRVEVVLSDAQGEFADDGKRTLL